MMEQGAQGIDHALVDEQGWAERYLRGTLAEDYRRQFAYHLRDCEECRDRLALAGIWLHKKIVRPPSSPPVAHADAGRKTSEQTAVPGALDRQRPLPLYYDSYPLMALLKATGIIAMLMQVIYLQMYCLEQLDRGNREWEEIPFRARVAAFLTPWQWLVFGSAAALMLVLIPATFFIWEMQKLTAR